MNDKWINIYECPVPEQQSKIWLQEILEDNNIPFESRVEAYYEGIKIPKYKEKFVIYIPVDFKQQVQEYIDEFNDPQNIITEGIEELETQQDYEDVEDVEEDSEKVEKKQKMMLRIYVGILAAMIAFLLIAGMLN